VVKKYGRYFGFTPKRFYKIRRHFLFNGGKTIFISKFVYSMNKITMITSGVVNVSYIKFIKFSGLAVIVWSIIFFTLGYVLGHSFSVLEKYVMGAEKILLVIVIIFVIIWYLAEKKLKKQVG